MEEKIPLIDVLRNTVQILGNISVPRMLNGQIGIPIDTAIGNLNACIAAIMKGDSEDGDSHAE